MARQITASTGNFLNVNTGAALNYPYSFSYRVKPSAGSSGYHCSYGEAFPDWDVDYTGADTGQFAGGKGSTFGSTAPSFPGTAGQWALVVCVATANNNRKFYLNNSTQVGVDVTTYPFPGHTSKNLTLGGLLDGAGHIHGSTPSTCEIADVALWDTALTAADVDALFGSRPGSVKSANLKCWYKLGANGDLTSSAGTYPTMTIFGTCPVVADPAYGGVAETLQSILSADYRDYLPMSRINASLRVDDPLHRKLKFAFPITEVGAATIDDPINNGRLALVPASDIWEPDGGYVGFAGTQAYIYPAGVITQLPITASVWLKRFQTFSGGSVFYIGNASFWDGVYLSLDGSPANTITAIQVANNFGSYGTASTTGFPLSESQWTHITAVFENNARRRVYFNGRLITSDNTSLVPVYAWDRCWIWTTISGSLNNTHRRDLRVWSTALTDAEVFELYSRGYARSFRPVVPDRQFPAIWINPIQRFQLPRLAGAASLRPIAVKGTKATLHLGRLQGYAGIRPAMVKPEQLVRLFRLAGSAGLRTVQVKATPKVTFPRVQGAAYLRALRVKASPLFTLPRMVGYADLRALELHTFRGLWHEELANLYTNQIERERRVLLGADSMLEFFTQRGISTELRKTLNRDFSVYHVSSLAGPEEWFCDVIETGNPWELIREITDMCLKTHGQCLNFKIIALERPVEKGHCYRMRLQAMGDPRV